MTTCLSAGRRLALLALALGLAGCVETTAPMDALYYRAPSASGAASVATAAAPDQVAQILREAGLGDVRTGAATVKLSSRDARLVDCGTFVQVSLGNRAEFPATSREAVLMEGFPAPGLVQRGVETRSTVLLTRLSDGSGYAISETHTVTRRYQVLATGQRSTSRVSFDGTSDGVFPNQTSCRASGLVADLLR